MALADFDVYPSRKTVLVMKGKYLPGYISLIIALDFLHSQIKSSKLSSIYSQNEHKGSSVIFI